MDGPYLARCVLSQVKKGGGLIMIMERCDGHRQNVQHVAESFSFNFLDSSLTIKGSKGFPSLIPHTYTVTVTKVTCMFVLFFYVTLLRLLIRKQCVTIKMQISFSSTDFLPLDGSRLTGERGGGGLCG